MSIAGVEPVGVAAAEQKLTSSAAMGKEDFLNLLIAQLQHQDPLNPLESTEFTAQLAQFTSLEQLSSINQNLTGLQKYQSSMEEMQSVSFIGKIIEAPGNSVFSSGGKADDFRFDLTENVSELYINLYDPAGHYVRTLEKGAMPAGRNVVPWDGEDAYGNPLPEGQYTYEILATDPYGADVAANTFIASRVTGVSFGAGETYLLAGGHRIPTSSVSEIYENDKLPEEQLSK